MLKYILNVNGVFSYGYQRVMNDFYSLCEEKEIAHKNIYNFKIKEITAKNYDLEKVKNEFIDINKFVFENLIELLNKKIDNKNKIISCMGIVSCIKNNNIYVALLKDNNN